MKEKGLRERQTEKLTANRKLERNKVRQTWRKKEKRQKEWNKEETNKQRRWV